MATTRKTTKKQIEKSTIDTDTSNGSEMSVGATLLGGEKAKTESRDWSTYQRDIFLEIQNGFGHLVIQAVAGSGKTATIMESLKLIPESKTVLLLAFNRSIRDELKSRAPAHVEVKTLHGHGLNTISKYWRLKKASTMEEFMFDSKARDGQMMVASGAPGPYALNGWRDHFDKLRDLIFKSKSLLATTPELVRAVQEDYRLLVGEDGRANSWTFVEETDKNPVVLTADMVPNWVLQALRFSCSTPRDGIISFSDMVFAPAVLPKFIPTQYDFVFVDETQDMSADQLKLVLKTVKPDGGRIVVVGDDKQSIYRFRGADSEAMPRMERELSAKKLPLSISYRVPQCSAREAQKLVKDFRAADNAPEGICDKVSARTMVANWQNGDFVITRANWPIKSLVMVAIATGKHPLAIGGDDVPKSIREIITRALRKTPSISTPKALMRTVRSVIAEKVKAAEQQEKIRRKTWAAKYQLTDDELSDIPSVVLLTNTLAAIEMLANRFDNLNDLYAFIDSITISEKDVDEMSDEEKRKATKGRLVISSVHRIKGAEANRTWVLTETFKYGLGGWARGSDKLSPKEAQEEKNLWYVAVTRVKNEPGKPGELYYVGMLKEVLGGNPEVK